MQEVSVSGAILLLPFLALGVVVGLRRSWIAEGVTAGLLGIVMLAFDALRALMLAILRLLARIGTEVASAAGVGGPNLERTINRLPDTLVIVVCTILFVAAAYSVGSALGRGTGAGRLRRAAGGAIGALNVLLLLAIISARVQDVAGSGRLRQLFLVPGSRRGLNVEVSPFPAVSVLTGWTASAFMVLVMVGLLAMLVVGFNWAVNRLPKLRG